MLGNNKYHIGDVSGACSDWKKAIKLGSEKVVIAELVSENCN
tara:strand:- start:202 stop:327 length:126 start_codon:yes stop_codon:yes gene_type:complete